MVRTKPLETQGEQAADVSRGDPLGDLQRSTKLFFNATETGPILGLDPRTIRRACEAGQIPAFRVGRVWMISRETLLRLAGDQAA